MNLRRYLAYFVLALMAISIVALYLSHRRENLQQGYFTGEFYRSRFYDHKLMPAEAGQKDTDPVRQKWTKECTGTFDIKDANGGCWRGDYWNGDGHEVKDVTR